MKFIPIIFSTSMVQAILAGKKTMTRRVVKPQPIERGRIFDCNNKISLFDIHNWLEPFVDNFSRWLPGDVLWVRESWAPGGNLTFGVGFIYKANNYPDGIVKWKPSIHMPKEACRLFLKVKSIKVERLQDISGTDAVAEGCSGLPDSGIAQSNFQKLWLMINGDESWYANPWVWAIEFERIEKPENFK